MFVSSEDTTQIMVALLLCNLITSKPFNGDDGNFRSKVEDSDGNGDDDDDGDDDSVIVIVR